MTKLKTLKSFWQSAQENRREGKKEEENQNKTKNRMAVAKLFALNANTIRHFLSVSHKCIYFSFNIINTAIACLLAHVIFFFILLISEMKISYLSPLSYLSPIMFILIPRLWSFYVMKIYLSPLSYLFPIMFILILRLWNFMFSPLCFTAKIFVFKRLYGESFWRKKFACCFTSVLTFLCFNIYLDLKLNN